MTEQERTQVATQIADLLNGLSIKDAFNIIGEAENISAKNGNQHHALISLYVIAELVSSANAQKAVITIEDDGSVSFELKAKEQ
jgi:hypothetical protein